MFTIPLINVVKAPDEDLFFLPCPFPCKSNKLLKLLNALNIAKEMKRGGEVAVNGNRRNKMKQPRSHLAKQDDLFHWCFSQGRYKRLQIKLL